MGAIRLVHPFPSILDGTIVALVATAAGAGPGLALLLGVSMTLLQFSIGALNDIVDAPRDAGHKPHKPIPGGLVSLQGARGVAIACAAAGLVLAFAGGLALVALAAIGLAIGVTYDLRAKGTRLSWVPFAVGIPLLPVYGWFGAAGTLPGAFLVLIPAAAAAGSALAIANAIVDVDRDRDAGSASIATALGATLASGIVLALHLLVAVFALATAVALGAPAGWVAAILVAAVGPTGGALLGLVGASREDSGWPELAWEIQAVGSGLLAVAWTSALGAAAALPPGS